ncbi:MAG: C-GCAxxG-C-C family protein [Desulfobacterales bacterium]|jgi:C_GCAxxG_C_C family probable redox protein|nr:C-GCAxxG-C-C family protein [Desulfobacterales bacterium]
MGNKEIKKTVYGHYESGLHCAEVVSKTILNKFSDKEHPEAVKIASGFGGGIAGSMEELCGAFTGGIIALSSLVGRENPGENMKDYAILSSEFKEKFLEKFGTLNCHSLLEGFNKQENPFGCVKLTASASIILADILTEFEKEKQIDINTLSCQPRDKVELGQCPFRGCGC